MDLVIDLVTDALELWCIPPGANSSWSLRLLVDAIGTYLALSIGGMIFYLTFASLSYLLFYVWLGSKFFPSTLPQEQKKLREQMGEEIGYAMWSLPIMAILMTPFPMLLSRGFGRIYYAVNDYGWPYLFGSAIFYVLLADALIYLIHRGLHVGVIYQYVHKPHHRFRYTTPFSSHAFHPIDGWAQGVPYYIVPLFLPIHWGLLQVLFVVVNFWTISIHDQIDFCGGGFLNSTGHHTIHHATFMSNYGQYTTIWDRMFGTYKPATQTHTLGSCSRAYLQGHVKAA